MTDFQRDLLKRVIVDVVQRYNHGKMPSTRGVDGQIDSGGYGYWHQSEHATVHARHYHVSGLVFNFVADPMPGDTGEIDISEDMIRQQLKSRLRDDLPRGAHILIDNVRRLYVVSYSKQTEHSHAHQGTIDRRHPSDAVPALEGVLHHAYEDGAFLGRVAVQGWDKAHRYWCRDDLEAFVWSPMRNGPDLAKDFTRLLATYTHLLTHERLIVLKNIKDLDEAKQHDSPDPSDVVVYLHVAKGHVHWATSNPEALRAVVALDCDRVWCNPEELSRERVLEIYNSETTAQELLHVHAHGNDAFKTVHHIDRHDVEEEWAPNEFKVMGYEQAPHHRLEDALHQYATPGYHDFKVSFDIQGKEPVEVAVSLAVSFHVTQVQSHVGNLV